jgi:hypothetical protein
MKTWTVKSIWELPLWTVVMLSSLSCERSERAVQHELQMFSTLKDAMTETQIAIAEQKILDTNALMGSVASQLLSTNKSGVKLLSGFDSVWFNGNLGDWFASTSNGRPALPTAMVGSFTVEGKIRLIGISFDARAVPQNTQPTMRDFIKVELTSK